MRTGGREGGQSRAEALPRADEVFTKPKEAALRKAIIDQDTEQHIGGSQPLWRRWWPSVLPLLSPPWSSVREAIIWTPSS